MPVSRPTSPRPSAGTSSTPGSAPAGHDAARLVFHPGIEADIEEIVAFYGERDPALPSAFRARLKEQVDGVRLFPRAGAVLFEDYRRVLLKQFPFMVVYSASDDAIYVLAIVHVRRDPANIQGEVAERAEE